MHKSFPTGLRTRSSRTIFVAEGWRASLKFLFRIRFGRCREVFLAEVRQAELLEEVWNRRWTAFLAESVPQLVHRGLQEVCRGWTGTLFSGITDHGAKDGWLVRESVCGSTF